MRKKRWKFSGRVAGNAAGGFTGQTGGASREGCRKGYPERFGSDFVAPRRDAAAGQRRGLCDFLGRKVYVAIVVVMASAALTGPTRTSLGRLRELYGVSRRALWRWARWWRLTFVLDRRYLEVGGMLVPAVSEDALPYSLLMRFQPDDPFEKLLSFLKFLAR